MIQKLLCLFLLLVFAIGLHASVVAEETNINKLMLLINQKTKDSAVKQQAMRAGQERALLCSYCHGPDGNSINPDVPNLAGQNAVYLLDQISKFADGRRKNYVMNSLAKELTLEDKLNLAVFFATKSVKQVSVDEQMAAKGSQVYRDVCSNCHGTQGMGDVHFPRLAGQRPEYVKITLKRFKENTNAYKKVKEEATQRRNSVMESIVKNLSDDQIDAVAAYVAKL